MHSKLFALVVAAIAGLLSIGGCAAPEDGDDASSDGESALASDELEAAVLVETDSSSREHTGVDRWRLSLVKKEGIEAPFLVAIGLRAGKEVLDVVITRSESGPTNVRLAADVEPDFSPEFRAALAADLKRLRRALAPEWTDEAMAEEVRARAARAASASVVDCSKLELAKQLNEGSLLFTGAALIPACGPGVLAAGVSIPVCIFYATVGAVQVFRTVRARSAFSACVAESKRD